MIPTALTMNFVGDVMLGETFEHYKRGVRSSINRGVNPFEYCADQFAAGDLTIANLECVISDFSSQPPPYADVMRVERQCVSVLTDNRITLVNLANNHTFDHGPKAFQDMVDILDSHGIRHFGYPRRKEVQRTPLVIEKRGVKLGFLGYDLSNLPNARLEHFAKDITAILSDVRGGCDLLTLSLHWGYEYSNIMPSKFLEFGKTFLDKGVDILHGHHSHTLHGVVNYRGKILAPSLGNFIFDCRFPSCWITGILEVKVEGSDRVMSHRLHPYLINRDFQPESRPDLLPEIDTLNQYVHSMTGGTVEERKKLDKKAERKSKLGHFRNSVYIRITFILHLKYYARYVRMIMKRYYEKHVQLRNSGSTP